MLFLYIFCLGPGTAQRGDLGGIVLEDGCIVQENCTIHLFPGVRVYLRAGAHIGHGAIIHGAEIGRNCLVGMNAVIMDRLVLGEENIVGALTFVKEGEIIPPRSLGVGNPGIIIRQVSDEVIAWKTKSTGLCRALPCEMKAWWVECEPLIGLPGGFSTKSGTQKPWKEK